MTVKGGTSPACAVCKYQRRKCSSECVLAPYFPANQPKAFRNVHRLFGVSNIVKILKILHTDEQKEEAMKSIKYESDMRERYPVYGCAGIICQLRQQLRQAIEELHYVYAQLAVWRQQLDNNQTASTSHFPPPSHLQLGIGNTTTTIDNSLPLVQQPNEIPYTMNYFLTTNEYEDHVDSSHQLGKNLMELDPYYDVARNNNSIGIQEQFDASDALGVQQEKQVFQDYGDMDFNTMADDRQSYVETNEACDEECESSSESSFRDFTESVDQVSKSELRNAAACFSLTNIK